MNKKTIFYRIKRTEPIAHIIFWCIVLFFPYIKYMPNEGGYQMGIFHELNTLLFAMIPTYVVYLWFFPLKNKKKYVPLVIFIFVINAFTFGYFDNFFHPKNHQPHQWMQFLSSITTYLTFSFVFFALYSFKKLYRKQIELDAITRGKNRAELEGLKAQVNPHFLFNTLNTIYSSALKKDDKTPEMILKLSDNFRYMIDEGQQEKVFLKREIAHLKNYIDLQKERLSDKVLVDWKEDIDTYEQEISPLLLILFVENAFKYTSILKGQGHIIKIEITLKNRELSFYCENPSQENYQNEIEPNWKNSGIGIQNTKQRLSLLYPEKHQLDITNDTKLFKVKLTIQL
ncbi:MAG: histidine kinase [Flavobacteriaceae bacterium]|nr:histidine kinase [Flavobacteriaceae bacterium]